MPRLISREGRAEDVADANVEAALRAGYRPESGLDVLEASDARIVSDRQAARGPLDQVAAAGLGFARGATFGLSDALVGDAELTDNLKTDFAATSALSEVAGAIAPGLLTGGTSTAASVARALPAGRAALAAGAVARGGGVARAAAAAALEGAAQNAGYYLADAALHDKDLSAEAFLAEAGSGALMAGAVGGGLAAAERGMVAARSLLPKAAGSPAAVRKASDDVDAALTKALAAGDDNVRRGVARLDTIAASDPELLAAAQAKAAERAATVGDLKVAEQRARTDLAELRLDRARNPPARSSRPRKSRPPVDAAPADAPVPSAAAAPPTQATDAATPSKPPLTDDEVQTRNGIRQPVVDAADAGDDLMALLSKSKDRLAAGESIGALNAEARGAAPAAPPSAIQPVHEAMAEINSEAARVVEAIKEQERAAEAVRRRFTIRDADGAHRVALGDLEGMTVGRIKQAYLDADDAEKAAILEVIGPQKAQALTDIVEGRAKFDRWYKNKAHLYEDGSYNPAEAFPLETPDLEMRAPTTAPPDMPGVPDLDLGTADDVIGRAEAVTANKTIGELAQLERAHVALTDTLGPAASPQAAEIAQGASEALAAQERKAVARLAQSADDEAARAALTVSLPGAGSAAPARRGGVLGLAADAAAASEALQAVGLPTPFDVDKIPLIGPLVGLYAKYRAASAVMRKAGLRVPFSGEARVAGAAAKQRDAIADSVDRLLDRSAKAVARARQPIAANAWRAADVISDRMFDDGKRRKTATMAEAMEARSEELRAAAASPSAVRAAVRASMRDVSDPDLIDAAVAVAQRKVTYLAKHAPQPPTPDLLSRSKWQPSPSEVERFARRVRAANNPRSVLDDIATGRVTVEAADTLREVYPRLYQEAQGRLVERAAELRERLPHALVVRLSMLFNAPLVRSLAPEHMAAIQSASAQPQQQSAAPPAIGGMQPPPAGAPNVSSLYTTPADARGMR